MTRTRSLKPLLLAAGFLLLPLRVLADPSVPVRVTNLPATQAVSGTVNIGNPVQISGPVTVTGSVAATIPAGSVSATLAPGAVVEIKNGISYQKLTEGANSSNVILPNPAASGQQLIIDSLYITVSDAVPLPPNPMMGVYGTHVGNSGLVLDYSLLVPCLPVGVSSSSYTVACNLLQTGIVLPAGETLLVNGLTFSANLSIVQFSRIVAAH